MSLLESKKYAIKFQIHFNPNILKKLRNSACVKGKKVAELFLVNRSY